MVLTERIELDIFHHHHLPVVFLEQSGSKNSLRVFLISLAKELESLSDPFGGLNQAVTFRVFPDA